MKRYIFFEVGDELLVGDECYLGGTKCWKKLTYDGRMNNPASLVRRLCIPPAKKSAPEKPTSTQYRKITINHETIRCARKQRHGKRR